VFTVLFLDAQNRLIELKDMFRGTVTQTSVYPREVVKEALSSQRRSGDPGPQPSIGLGGAESGR
jgi:DNA repair protein RadC